MGLGQSAGRTVGPSDNYIVTIKQRHDLPREHSDYSANRYETFGLYTESEANQLADRLVAMGYKVLIQRLAKFGSEA